MSLEIKRVSESEESENWDSGFTTSLLRIQSMNKMSSFISNASGMEAGQMQVGGQNVGFKM